jgi:UDP-glucose 4-epimerase
VEHAPARTGEQLRSSVTIGKAASVLGWTPRTGLAEGLAETYSWFAGQRAPGAGR